MGGPPLEFINIQPNKEGPPLVFINQRGGGSASRSHQLDGGPPLEIINIQPPKGGPPLQFINIQPQKGTISMDLAVKIGEGSGPR